MFSVYIFITVALHLVLLEELNKFFESEEIEITRI
jgi:hypothetical protein